MKINKEELRAIANQLKVDIEDSELEQLNEAIYKITDKLNEIFEEDTEGYDRTRTMAFNEQDVNKEAQEFTQKVDMQTVNNYDGEFVRIKKEQNEE